MSARQPKAAVSAARSAPAGPADFDALEISRLTWIGLVVAALGWALMIGETAAADVVRAGRATASLHADLVEIARCMIGSGFGLAVVGALQSGFGTLNRFFEAVLSRSAQRAPAASAPAPVASAAPTRARRPYRTLADGSVEVETILGTRRFATMHEAAEFI